MKIKNKVANSVRDNLAASSLSVNANECFVETYWLANGRNPAVNVYCSV